jgi:hypothetical protein
VQSFSTTEEEKQLRPHEYIRDTITFRYRNCISCGTRTEFTCLKCGYCYSCHWKKEQVEEIELRDNRKDFYLSLSEKQTRTLQKDGENESSAEKEGKKWGTLNALGNPAEPICNYYRCHHEFSLHGSRRCKCKHPTNKVLGIEVKYL